jgi:NAD(P)-dependent dehydrogenase (short-subunit alcohol dehydrogenase family)
VSTTEKKIEAATRTRTPSVKPPKRWGFTDEQLATHPTVYRDDLLKGQTVLVSGGGSGLGRAMAYLFARLGADVMICGRREDMLAATAAGIKQHLGRSIGYKAMTIRDPQMVEDLVKATWDKFGRLDVLVNNGGGQFPQAAIDFTQKGWLAVIDTNLNGSWYMMQSAARQWQAHGRGGSIVSIVANVTRGMPQVAHTCAARAGVIGLTKTLSTEWAPLKIRVNCVSPGSIATDGLNVYPPGAAEEFRYSNPMKTLGDAYDIAQAVVYLSADTGKFITGEVLTVDGGNNQWGDVWPGLKPDYFKLEDR